MAHLYSCVVCRKRHNPDKKKGQAHYMYDYARLPQELADRHRAGEQLTKKDFPSTTMPVRPQAGF